MEKKNLETENHTERLETVPDGVPAVLCIVYFVRFQPIRIQRSATFHVCGETDHYRGLVPLCMVVVCG